jgi:hypothetical protein
MGEDIRRPESISEGGDDPRKHYDLEGHKKNVRLIPNFISHLLAMYLDDVNPDDLVIVVEMVTLDTKTTQTHRHKLVLPAQAFEGVPPTEGMDPTADEHKDIIRQLKTLGRKVSYEELKKAYTRGPDGKLVGFSRIIVAPGGSV